MERDMLLGWIWSSYKYWANGRNGDNALLFWEIMARMGYHVYDALY